MVLQLGGSALRESWPQMWCWLHTDVMFATCYAQMWSLWFPTRARDLVHGRLPTATQLIFALFNFPSRIPNLLILQPASAKLAAAAYFVPVEVLLARCFNLSKLFHRWFLYNIHSLATKIDQCNWLVDWEQRLLLDVESTFWVFWVGSVENQFSCLNYPAMGAKITAERLLDKAKLRRVGWGQI